MSKGRIRLGETVRAPVEVVFGFLTDLSRVPEWDARIARVTQMTRGALRPGVILRSTLLVNGESAHLDDEVTDFEPPTRFGLRSVLGATDAVTYTLSGNDEGNTSVEVILAYDLPDPPTGADIDENELRNAIAVALGHSLSLLKALVEGDVAPRT